MTDTPQTKTPKAPAAPKVDPKNVDVNEAAAVAAGEFLSEPGAAVTLSNGVVVRTF